MPLSGIAGKDRGGLRSTIVTSQLPVARWHEALGEPPVADAILDRLVHDSYRLELTGASIRQSGVTLDDVAPAADPTPETAPSDGDEPARTRKRRSASRADAAGMPDYRETDERR